MNWTVNTLRDIAWPDLESSQKELVERVRREPGRGFLLVSEPRATYTHGRSSQPGDLLNPSPAISIHEVARGGKWTYHGPGQILVYPIVRLEDLGYGRRDVLRFVNDLRSGLSAFLRARGVAHEVGEEPYGIFNAGRKLASFGISTEGGIVTHGLALYLRSQIEPFRGINPCGFAGAPITSLAELGHGIDWEDAAGQLTEFIKNAFKSGLGAGSLDR